MAILTVDQCSKEYFNGALGKTKLYDLIKKRLIPVIQISSRKYYFDTEELDKWVKAKSNLDEVIATEVNLEVSKIKVLKPL